MLKYGVNLQKMLYFLSLFKKISAHKRFIHWLNIGNRLFSGTVWLSISYCNQVKSSSCNCPKLTLSMRVFGPRNSAYAFDPRQTYNQCWPSPTVVLLLL